MAKVDVGSSPVSFRRINVDNMDTQEPVYAPIGHSCCAGVCEYARGEVLQSDYYSTVRLSVWLDSVREIASRSATNEYRQCKTESECRNVLDSGTKIAERGYCEQ